jgi:hypothetical protein
VVVVVEVMEVVEEEKAEEARHFSTVRRTGEEGMGADNPAALALDVGLTLALDADQMVQYRLPTVQHQRRLNVPRQRLLQ